MKHRLLAPVLAVVLVLAIATGTAWSMSSTSFNMVFDSFMGGGSGGGVSTSTGFRIEGSFGGAVHMFDTSSSFKLCSGFACLGVSLQEISYKDFLPMTVK